MTKESLIAIEIIKARLPHIEGNVMMSILSMLVDNEEFTNAVCGNNYSDYDLVHDLSGMLKPDNEFFVPRIG